MRRIRPLMAESLSSIGMRGIQTGLSCAAQSASKVTSGFEGGSDAEVLDGALGLKAAKRQVEASARVVRTDAELQKSILAILA